MKLKIQPLHRLNEVSEKWRRVPSTDGFFHVPNFDQNRNLFQSRPLHRRSIHAEFKPLHRLNEVSEKWRSVSSQTLLFIVQTLVRGCGSPVVKVSNHGRHVMSSIPVPLKTHRVGQRCTLNLSRAETSSRWCGVVVRRGGCQLRCRPRHLTMVQNYVVRRQKPSCS
ncbi:uncharacterized protein TNCV_3084451 [Trichonephila clavipes]|nr:uncharacterized protein TNCV_3084451 [Trichonephila clavipes]